MHSVVLGRTDIRVSYLTLGCSRIGSALSGCHGAAAIRLIHRAIDLGITAFDTANIYGQGESERLLGEALSGRRSKLVLATKAGQVFTARQRALAVLKGPIRTIAARIPQAAKTVARSRQGELPRNYDPERLGRALEKSLRRLKTDHVDIFYLHSPCPQDSVPPHIADHMESLKRAGKIRAWGLSCDEDSGLLSVLNASAPDILQLPISVLDDPLIRARCAALRDRGTAILGRGFVARATSGTLAPPSSLWASALARSDISAAIYGTTKIEHLEETVAALTEAERGSAQAPMP